MKVLLSLTLLFLTAAGCTTAYNQRSSCPSPRAVALGDGGAPRPLLHGLHTAGANLATSLYGLPDEATYEAEYEHIQAGATDKHGQFQQGSASCRRIRSEAGWFPSIGQLGKDVYDVIVE